MKKIFALLLIFVCVLGFFAVPQFSFAQGSPDLVVCGDNVVNGEIMNKCNFNHLLTLINNAMRFLIYISIPITAGLYIWAGLLYTTASDDSNKTTKAKEIFKTTTIGFLIMLSAWVIVYTLVVGLTDYEGFKLLRYLKN